MNDPVIPALDAVVRTPSAAGQVREALQRVLQQLALSREQMAWEIIPLSALGCSLPESIRSCWVFGSGIFEVREAPGWTACGLVSEPSAAIEQRWVTIPPATWHRLFVGQQAWGMVSFHTVAPEELIEERPVDPDDLDGRTHQERYAGRR